MKKRFPFPRSIRAKLLLSYFAFIFLPLTLLAGVSTYQVSAMFEQQVRYAVGQAFDQGGTFLDYKINSMVRISDMVHFNEDVQAILTKPRALYEKDVYAQTADASTLDTFLSNLKNREDVYRAAIYVPGWLAYAAQGVSFHNLDELETTDVFERLMSTKEKVLWLPPQEVRNEHMSLPTVRAVSLLRRIRNSNSLTSIIGIIRLSMLEDVLLGILHNAKATQNSLIFLVNTDNALVCGTDGAQALAMLGDAALIGYWQGLAQAWETVTHEDKQFYLLSQRINNTDWTMVSLVPHADIYAQGANIRRLMLPIGILIGILAYIVAFALSASSVRRMRLLSESMRQVQEGALSISLRASSHDEIDEVMETFNYMVQRIRLLLDEQYQLGISIKNAELKALQSQINPHFLYNTLELIGWKAMASDTQEVNVLVKALARFYKLSLNKGGDFIPIADELNHVQAYMQIQNMRFEHQIHLVTDVEECLLTQRIVKIILQPLAENAILHGFWGKQEDSANTLTITGRCLPEQGLTLLTVRDNGSGMPEATCSRLLERPDSNADHGYGVYNIHQRLQLCYGPAYGLTYHLPPEGGVLVEIRIPYP